MCSVRIVADSGCDLPPTLAAQYDITVVPCVVRFGDDAANDLDMSPAEFWERARQSPQAPATAAPPPGVFRAAFEPLVRAGHDVVCLTLPRKHSAVFDSARLGAEEFGARVRVLDSGSITLGIGLTSVAAAKAAQAGHDLDVVQRTVESARARTSVIFALDTLEWVKRGGRFERLMPLIDRVARTFSVKPVVEIIEGDMHLLGVTRSTRGAIERIEEEVRSRLPVESLATAYTVGRQAADELAHRLANLVGSVKHEILVHEAGPIFATHAGPNALGAVVVRAT